MRIARTTRDGFAFAAAGLLLAALASCSRGPESHAAHGVVQDVNLELGQVVIAHEDIPGLMPAMTMSFDVPDAKLLAQLSPGQAIHFEVAFDGRSYRVVSAALIEAGVATSPDSPKLSDAAAEQELAPPFRLIDQNSSALSLEDLRGKVVLLDFIYTSCPGPCPILTGVLVSVQRELDPSLRARVHFVSISLDPVRDTPTALREYARKRGAELSGWSFLTGAPDEVDAVIRAYGVGSVRQPDGTIAHLVVSFVIDGQGRIVHRQIGLEDTDPARIREDVERLARSLPPSGGPG
jgi:protein SCO1/2